MARSNVKLLEQIKALITEEVDRLYPTDHPSRSDILLLQVGLVTKITNLLGIKIPDNREGVVGGPNP